MTLRSLGLIGFGNIARALVGVLCEALPAPLDHVAVAVRPGTSAAARRALADTLAPRLCRASSAHDSAAALAGALASGTGPSLVIECAGHAAVREHVPVTLAAGLETIVTSVGALGDEALHAALVRAAGEGGTRLVVPSGAIGGLDVVAGLRRAGIESARYRGRKPPHAWRGTPAESIVDLDAVDEAVAFYTGSARAAVRDYPRNANVAAAIALAGVGFDDTVVTLIADPGVRLNVHELDVRSAAGSVSLRVEGRPSADNPKTSLPTVYSLVREVLNRTGPVAV